MTGEIISMMAQAAPATSRLDEPVLRSVSPDEAGRFTDLMGAQNVQPPADVQPVDRVAEPRIASDKTGLGDSIIRSMESAGRSYTEAASRIHATFDGSAMNISMPDILRMQWDMLNTSLSVDLISKGVQKTTQHVDSLTKLQ